MFVKSDELKIIKKILTKYTTGLEVRVFGSRATGKNLKTFSDLDLAIITDRPLDTKLYIDIKDAFTESDLPYKVDIVDWASSSKEFRQVIKNESVIVQGRKL